MQKCLRPWFLIVGLSAASSAACGDSGSSGRSPLGPGSAAPSRIELMAPEAVPPGETARFAVLAHFSDGSLREVTADATYSSSDTAVLAVQPGQVIAAARGEATVAVTYVGLCVARLIFSMPTGTYRLTGIVTDTDTAVAGADVVVTSGAGAGLATRTDAAGHYRLYGVAGDTRIEIRKSGLLRVETVDVSEHTQFDVDLGAAAAA